MGRLNAGQLSERVTLLLPAATSGDGQGGELPGLPTSKSVWAAVRQLSARELVALGQVTNSMGYSLTIRYLGQVNAKLRVVYRGVVLNVLGVLPDQRREYMELTCFDSGKYAPPPTTDPVGLGYPATYQATY